MDQSTYHQLFFNYFLIGNPVTLLYSHNFRSKVWLEFWI